MSGIIIDYAPRGRYFARTALVLLCLLGVACSSSARLALNAIPERPDALGLEKDTVKIPPVERWTMANGIEVYYAFNDELPTVRGTMFFPGGSLTDASGLAGLPDATGSQMREGSIKGRSPEWLDKHLDDLAASIESSFDAEYGTVKFGALAEDFDEVLTLFSKVIREPAFDARRLALWKRLASESIVRRKDDPGTMAGMAFAEILYGKDTPFTRTVNNEDLAALTQDKLRDFHQKYVRPDGARLAISGAISKEALQASLERVFGDWQPGTYVRPGLPAVTAPHKTGVYVLERDFDQAAVLIGHRGPPRLTDDQYAISILNRVYGHGGFSSVLFKEIRSRLGLAYSVYGGLFPGPVEGTFQVDMGTRATESVRAVKETLRLTEQTLKDLPPDESFSNAKSAVERSFVFKFAEPGYVVERAVLLDLLGYPADYDAKFLDNVDRVSREDVRESAERWIRPNETAVVIVGKISPAQVKQALGPEFEVYPVSFTTEPQFGAALP